MDNFKPSTTGFALKDPMSSGGREGHTPRTVGLSGRDLRDILQKPTLALGIDWQDDMAK